MCLSFPAFAGNIEDAFTDVFNKKFPVKVKMGASGTEDDLPKLSSSFGFQLYPGVKLTTGFSTDSNMDLDGGLLKIKVSTGLVEKLKNITTIYK